MSDFGDNKTTGRWRALARPIIAEVLARTADKDEVTIRRALRDAYPFGPKRWHPYQIWLDEIAEQRGLKRKRQQELPSDQLTL